MMPVDDMLVIKTTDKASFKMQAFHEIESDPEELHQSKIKIHIVADYDINMDISADEIDDIDISFAERQCYAEIIGGCGFIGVPASPHCAV